jgi:hypothetical protein
MKYYFTAIVLKQETTSNEKGRFFLSFRKMPPSPLDGAT